MSMGPHEECGSGVEVPTATEAGHARHRDPDSILKAGFELALVLVNAAEAATSVL
ncbi:hypothetical protein [Nocardia sp. NPDC050710]|uniref:hypothetical protein n=1 Tax=Nocardia sp. NPDC050710 TaxID=3157220 RepID=UPI0033E5F3D3